MNSAISIVGGEKGLLSVVFGRNWRYDLCFKAAWIELTPNDEGKKDGILKKPTQNLNDMTCRV